MPTQFDLPTLSDKDYASLLQELTAAIPHYSDTWTDFNFSDPGTTLLQLLSWLGDVSLYRIDQVPTELYVNFLRLLVGATGETLVELVETLEEDIVRGPRGAELDLDGDPVLMDPARLKLARLLLAIENGAAVDPTAIRAAATGFWRTPYRAVTREDYAALAKQVSLGVADSSPEFKVERVVVLVDPPWIRVMPVSGYVPGYSTDTEFPDLPPYSVLESSWFFDDDDWNTVGRPAYRDLVEVIRAYLEPRRLIGTPVQVAPPLASPVVARVTLAVEQDADPETVADAALAAIAARLSPLTGGPEGTGWPYGRKVTDYDILNAVLPTPGIDRGQPIEAEAVQADAFRLGVSKLGTGTVIGAPGVYGLPLFMRGTIEVLSSTWTLQVGIHSTLGADTVLPRAPL
jgi:hypothetical protein